MPDRGLPIAYPSATRVVRRQFQQHIVDRTRVWRNSAREYDWYDLEYTVRTAAVLAGDMGLSDGRMTLERTLTRGQFILRRFGCPAVTLRVFTDKLPNTRGLARGLINRDLKDGRAIQTAQGPVSAAGTAPHKGSVRGRGAYSGPALRGHSVVAGFSSPRVLLAGFAPLAAGGRRGAAATKPVVLPLPSVAGSSKNSRSEKSSRKGMAAAAAPRLSRRPTALCYQWPGLTR